MLVWVKKLMNEGECSVSVFLDVDVKKKREKIELEEWQTGTKTTD